jgi:PHD/YefM family antitoxin component YafN of YafNO toxin-antitoxin module
MLSIAANDLKTRGIAAIEAGLASHSEATISVRGKERFVVMPLEQYNFFRECELELALLQTQADIAVGRYRIQSAQEHQAEIEAELAHEKNN